MNAKNVDEASQKLISDYNFELRRFEKMFGDEEKCRRRIFSWLGWEGGGSNVKFRCPKCQHDEAYYVEKEDKGKVRVVYQCKKNTGHQISILAPTIMKGARTSVRFWFFCIYAIGLLDGEVPRQFLISRGKDFLVNNEEEEDDDDDDGSIAISLRDVDSIINKVRKAFEIEEEKRKYLQLVGLGDYSDFLEWYDGGKYPKWKIGWKRTKFEKNSDQYKTLCTRFGDISYIFEVEKGRVLQGDWILSCSVTSGGYVRKIRWVYVHSVHKALSGKGEEYSHVAIQLKERKSYLKPPYRLTDDFKDAVKQLKDKTWLKEITKNKKFIVSSKQLKQLARMIESTR